MTIRSFKSGISRHQSSLLPPLRAGLCGSFRPRPGTFTRHGVGQIIPVTSAIAAPIAREINKVESGDYNFGGLGTLFHSIANQVAVYGAPLGTPDAAAPPPPARH